MLSHKTPPETLSFPFPSHSVCILPSGFHTTIQPRPTPNLFALENRTYKDKEQRKTKRKKKKKNLL